MSVFDSTEKHNKVEMTTPVSSCVCGRGTSGLNELSVIYSVINVILNPGRLLNKPKATTRGLREDRGLRATRTNWNELSRGIPAIFICFC